MSTSLWAAELTNARVTLAGFLKSLLEHKIVDAIYAPLRIEGGGVAPALVQRADLLDAADPLAPTMLINGARAVAALTAGGSGRIAAVLRPCEIRALIELTKLKQASLDHLMIIGLDCAGVYDLADYARLCGALEDPTVQLLAEAAEGHIRPHDGMALRPACRMCETPAPANAQITVGFIGVDGLMITLDEDLASRLGLTENGEGASWPVIPQGDLAFREDIIQRLASERRERRDEAMAQLHTTLHDAHGLAGYFAACQRCHNCMVVCPLCYCKECLFHARLRLSMSRSATCATPGARARRACWLTRCSST